MTANFRITVEPVIVKRYRKTLANRGFCKKKLDTRFDTHCIKTGVQLWCERGDSNPHGITTRTSNVLVYHSNTLANVLIYYNLGNLICQHFFYKSPKSKQEDTVSGALPFVTGFS